MVSLTLKERIRSVSLIFACGTALFSDGYANNVISSVNILLARIYGSDRIEAHNYGTTVRSLAFAGTIVGMMVFGMIPLFTRFQYTYVGWVGWLSDKVGRKFGMMAASGIVVVFSGLSAASSGAHGSLGGMLAMLSAMRFLLGIGIGAEYPCGSVSASEQSEEPGISKRAQHRWLALSTDTMINIGSMSSSFVPLVLFWIFGDNHLRAVWRLSLGLGVVPASAVFIWRLNMEEPERFKKDSMKFAKVPYWLVLKRYWVSLSAVSMIWFLYDFIVYPFAIYSTTIIDNVTGGSDSLAVILGWNVVIHLFGLPGTTGGAFVIDYLGPKYTLITGLVLQAVVGFIMGGLYEKLTKNIPAFVVVYGIFLTLGEFGPGNCTFILASKSSATAIRGQFFGTAAAIGKVGAFIGTWAFPPMIEAFGGPKSARGNTGPFLVSSGLALLNAIITLLFVKSPTHDGMAEEDRAFRLYLEDHGYDTSQMGLLSTTEASQLETVEKTASSSEEKV